MDKYGFMGLGTPRLHLAEACVLSLRDSAARNRSFDLACDPDDKPAKQGADGGDVPPRQGIQADAFRGAGAVLLPAGQALE